MRYVFLDTETTGISHQTGHRVIEIGLLEMVNRQLTGKHFHTYLNPRRDIDPGAERVHGLSRNFLEDKPFFEHIVQDFIQFIEDSTLIIHNAPFDLGFLNAELSKVNHPHILEEKLAVIDTLQMARQKHPGAKNNLDALCKRYGVDNRKRDFHGALLDASLLAEVYLAMTQGQESLRLKTEVTRTSVSARQNAGLVIEPSLEEIAAHQAYMESLGEGR